MASPDLLVLLLQATPVCSYRLFLHRLADSVVVVPSSNAGVHINNVQTLSGPAQLPPIIHDPSCTKSFGGYRKLSLLFQFGLSTTRATELSSNKPPQPYSDCHVENLAKSFLENRASSGLIQDWSLFRASRGLLGLIGTNSSAPNV